MKRYTLLLLVVIFSTTISSGENENILERLVPGETALFLKSAPIEKLVKATNDYLNNYLNQNEKANMLKNRDDIKKRIGIDFLNIDSYRRKHIDTSRSAGFSFLPKKEGKDQMIIALPVLDETKFPLSFISMLKQMDTVRMEEAKKSKIKRKKRDLKPVITQYKGVKVFQIHKDIFLGTTNQYCLIASTGSLLKKCIDITKGEGTSLKDDKRYGEFLSKNKKEFNLTIFIKSEFLAEAFRKKRTPRKNKNRRNHPPTSMNGLIKYAHHDRAAHPLLIQQRSSSTTPYDVINYAAGGLTYNSNQVIINFSADFNESNPMVNLIVGMLKTGTSGKAIFSRDVPFYTFSSLDLKHVDKVCKKGGPGCSPYKKMKETVKKELGVDVSKDFIPYYSGVSSVLFSSTVNKQKKMNVLVNLPMEKYKKTRALWNKMRRFLKKKYAKEKRFGSQKIGKNRVFWFSESPRNTLYFLYNRQGLYISNSVTMLSQLEKYKSPVKSESFSIANYFLPSTFFMAMLKKDSLLHSIMKMQAAQKRNVQGVARTIGDIFLTGNKEGKYISLELEVKLVKSN